MAVLQDTLKLMQELAGAHDFAVVSFSGGKDSLVVMDLACKVFKHVEAFHWFMVPGLRYIEEQMMAAKRRWGVDVVQIPHWDLINALREGVFCDAHDVLFEVEPMTLRDGYAYALETFGARLILNGMKECDGMQRKMFFSRIERHIGTANGAVWECIKSPIRKWHKRDVLDYLEANGIQPPRTPSGVVSFGVGLTHQSLTWLHDEYPDDYKKLLKWFPYAEAVLKRREWYGI